eukprot:9200538-Pyramimonas_sp.AAC.1
MVSRSNTRCSTCAARFNLARAVALCRRGSRRGGECGCRVARGRIVRVRAARWRAADRLRHSARRDALEATVVGNAVVRQVTPEQAVVLLEPLVLAVRDRAPGRVVLNAPVVSASVVPLITAVLASVVLLDRVPREVVQIEVALLVATTHAVLLNVVVGVAVGVA